MSDLLKRLRDGYTLPKCTPTEFAEAADKIERLQFEIAAFKKKLFSVGRYCFSEDDCIANGIDFAAYERAINDVIEAMTSKP